MPPVKKTPAKPAKKRTPAKRAAKPKEPVPVVYITWPGSVIAGPKGAFSVGQEVKVPRREVAWPKNVTYDAFEGVVAAIEPDGLAKIVPKGLAPA